MDSNLSEDILSGLISSLNFHASTMSSVRSCNHLTTPALITFFDGKKCQYC